MYAVEFARLRARRKPLGRDTGRVKRVGKENELGVHSAEGECVQHRAATTDW